MVLKGSGSVALLVYNEALPGQVIHRPDTKAF